MSKAGEISVIALFVLTLAAAVVATVLPFWSVVEIGSTATETKYGLWQTCVNVNGTEDCMDTSPNDDDCGHTFKAVQAFSLLTICFAFLSMVLSAAASFTGSKIANAVTPLLSVLTTSSSLLCWLLYGGWADDIACGNIKQFHASFWVQVGASCLAVIATLIVVMLHLSAGGFGLRSTVVTGVVPVQATPTKHGAGEMVLVEEP